MDESPFFNPFDLNFKNLANTCVLHWAGKLYALWENGRPYELDPRTLDTVGESLILNDVLSRSAPLAAHSRQGHLGYMCCILKTGRIMHAFVDHLLILQVVQ